MASILPAFQKVCLGRCAQVSRDSAPAVAEVGSTAASQPMPNGSCWHLHLSGNLDGSHPLCSQCSDLFIPLCPLSLTNLLGVLHCNGFWLTLGLLEWSSRLL